MKIKTHHRLILAAVAVLACSFAPSSSAQGNFDPAQMRERQMERYRERIEVKSDDDWKKLEPLIGKVMDAQRDSRALASFGGFGGRGGGGRGGGDGTRQGGDGAARTGDGAGRGGDRNRGGFGQPAVEVTELQKALEDKAPAEEVKAKVATLREARKTKDAAVEKAQDELRKALSPRQEAGAILAGLLK